MTITGETETDSRTGAAPGRRTTAPTRPSAAAGKKPATRPARDDRSDDYLRIDVC